MSTLRVRLNSDPHLPPFSVSAEVINANFEVVKRLTMRGEESIEVPPGVYLISARMPSGENVTAQTAIKENDPVTEVMLTPSRSRHEWLAWQHFLGETPKQETETTLADFPSTWLRLWVYHQERWSAEPTSWVTGRQHDRRLVLYELNQSEQPFRHRLIQVGGPEVPWRFVSIPPTLTVIQILIRPSQVPTELNGGLAVKVVSMDQRAETLSHYLRSGALEAAHTVSDEVLKQTEQFGDIPESPSSAREAEEMLRHKLQNPFGAAVGGYYLLRVGDYRRLHTWPNNFANWVEWLPDAAVIHAWQLLLQAGEGESARDEARRRLLEARRRGIPVLTEGLRRLIDGLRLYARNARAEGGGDAEVEQALEHVRRYAAAVDWNERLTTFYGATPDAPSLELVRGLPTDKGNLQFLPTL